MGHERIEYHDDKVIKWLNFNGIDMRELSFYHTLQDCPFILQPVEIKHEGNQIGLVFPRSEDLVFDFDPEKTFRRMIAILASLEEKHIVHLDFRPENFGIYQGEIYLRDFGNTYLMSGQRGYVSKNRYPIFRIRAPEFQDHHPLVSSLRSLQSLVIACPEETTSSERQDPSFVSRLNGSDFDQRSDLWSLACFLYFRLIGQWPVNHIGDYDRIDFEPLRPFGLVGDHVERILSALNYGDRPWASQIAQDLFVEKIEFSLNFTPIYGSSSLVYLIIFEGDTDIGMIKSNFHWIVQASRRVAKKGIPLGHVARLFAQEGEWNEDDIRIFQTLGLSLY